MNIGEKTKKVESVVLNEEVVKQKIQQHAKQLQENGQNIQKVQANLNALVDQNKVLQGAIRGLQDLLPKENDATFKPNSTGPDGKDVPQTDDAQPSGDAEPEAGPEEVAGPPEQSEA